MSAQVRLIRPEEVGAWSRSVSVPFLDPANTEDRHAHWDKYWRPHVEIGRTWAVEDRGRLVGNAGIFSRTVTLPGRPGTPCPVLPFAAVTAVGVHPTHRRQGLLRRLMTTMLDDARERGEVVAGLLASQASIYGRFGFGPATQAARYTIAPRESAFAVAAPVVELALLDPAEAAEVLPGLFERACAHQPGQVNRDGAVWSQMFEDPPEDRHGTSARSYVICPGGYAAWRTEDVVEADDSWGRVIVDDIVAETAGTEAALWRFLLDLDLVREVVVFPRPLDEPIRHRLVDLRQLRTSAVVDRLWLRIIDVPAALSARGYRQAGRMVLDVRAPADGDGSAGADPATGRWALDAGPDGVSCRRAAKAQPTDLVLGLADLSALLAGGMSASVLAAAGRVDEERTGALDLVDGVFASRVAPFTRTGF